MDFRFRISAALLSVALVAGCGGDDRGTPRDDLSQLVSGVADSAGTPQAFEKIFARGAAPAKSKRADFGRYAFWAKDVELSGDAATVTVELRDFDNQLVGEVQWAAVREDGRWKLQDAPLP